MPLFAALLAVLVDRERIGPARLIGYALIVAGILAIVRSQLVWGIVLIILGLLVGPGGVSLFT